MKKYIFTILILLNTYLNAIEEQQITKRKPQEWDAQAYAQGNWIQEKAALQFLQESGINLKGKNVLDVGCGTGNITAKIAETAQTVHGIDASKNMIDYAKKTYHANNLIFEHVFVEDFTPQKLYDIAVTFFCLQHVQDQQEALKKINMSLTHDGECFGTIRTAFNPRPIKLTVISEMIPKLQQHAYDFFKDKDIIKEMGIDAITDNEFKTMLTKAGFESISYKSKSMDCIIKSRKELEAIEIPIIMRRPIVQMMPYLLRQWFFKLYIDIYLTKLQQNEDGHYILPAIDTIVFHVRKIKE